MWHSPKLFLSDLHSGNWHKVSDFLNCGFAGCLLLPLSPCVCFSLFLSLSMFHHQAYTNKRYMENLSTLWALRITLGELLSVHTQTWARNSRVWYTHKYTHTRHIWPRETPNGTVKSLIQNSCSILHSQDYYPTCKVANGSLFCTGMFSYQHHHLLT